MFGGVIKRPFQVEEGDFCEGMGDKQFGSPVRLKVSKRRVVKRRGSAGRVRGAVRRQGHLCPPLLPSAAASTEIQLSLHRGL